MFGRWFGWASKGQLEEAKLTQLCVFEESVVMYDDGFFRPLEEAVNRWDRVCRASFEICGHHLEQRDRRLVREKGQPAVDGASFRAFFARKSWKAFTTLGKQIVRPPKGMPYLASPALERYREERAAMARLDRLEREGQLVARGDVREGLGRVAAIIRAAGDGLLQQFGPEAVELLNESLSDAEREIERLFSDEPLTVVKEESAE